MIQKIAHYQDSGIDLGDREEIAQLLVCTLGSHFVLFTKTLQFHWNVRGMSFGPLHALFEEGYSMLYNSVDSIAERIVQLGFLAPGSLSELKEASTIEDQLTKNISAEEMLKILRHDLIVLSRDMRKIAEKTAEKDSATNNKIADLLEGIEKYLWKIQSHLL